MKYKFLSVCTSLLLSSTAIANPGDVLIYNSSNNDGAVAYVLHVDSPTGPATSQIGPLNPGDAGTLSSGAIGKSTAHLYITAQNAKYPTSQNWKVISEIPNYSSQMSYSITCWYDPNHGSGCVSS